MGSMIGTTGEAARVARHANPAMRTATSAVAIETAGITLLRYGLVLILAWIGGFKFTHAEAEGIRPLIEHSPFMGWLYGVASVDGVSRLIGSSELVIAALLATRPFAPGLSALGSLLAIGTFVTTLSFLVTTPGTFAVVEGYLAPTAVGGFLVKDVFLLGAAVVTLGEALRAAQTRA